MKPKLYLALLLAVVSMALNTSAQDFSNKGKDFWIGYGNHVRMFNSGKSESMQLYITSDVNTTGQVTISSIGFSQSFTVTANQITTIDIPRTAALMDDGLFDHGIHVTAASAVVVYSFIFYNAQSGATVCLPTNTLGRDYYSVNFSQSSNEPFSYSYFFVIAADTGTTTVEITPSALTKGGKPASVPFLVTLTQGQVYQVLGSASGNSGVDLTGSRIRSVNMGKGCKRIAVYCGSGKISIGCTGSGSADNLYQQMYPTATWGKKYITVPGIINSNNYFRIVKSDPSATVWLNNTIVPASAFVNNFYYQFLSDQPNVITSDKPIMVAQYFTTQGCNGNGSPGDPEMIYLNPVEQTLKKVTLNAMQPATGTNINQHYLNVVLKNTGTALNSFQIDGQPFKNFISVPGDADYSYARIPTTKGTHNIGCDSGFNIIAYGFGSAESYGFSGGMNLKDLYQFASIKNQYATVDYPATCENAPFHFSMTFPYMPIEIQWKFNGLYPDEAITAPVADSTWFVNGRQLYLYKLKGTYAGPAPGTYPITIIANNPTSDGCTGEQEIDYDLKVYAKPLAKFSAADKICLKDTVYFKENYSATGERAAIQWLWNYGTADTSMLQNPKYVYKVPGTYTASFSVVTDIGCISDTAIQTIKVNPLPDNSFTTPLPFCTERDIVFTNTSTVTEGHITQWMWDMGNGKSFADSTGNPFTFKYAAPGNYKVTLKTITDQGCASDSAVKIMDLHPTPVAGFILPANCIKDPYSTFTDSSKMNDGTTPHLNYKWFFGDALSTPSNPDSASAASPKHKYTATGDYKVFQKVTSDFGCADSVAKTITINGSVPHASFSIKDGLDQCSNKLITLTNQSTVDVGAIVRLNIYWDFSDTSNNKTSDLYPKHDTAYLHRFPDYYGTGTQNYQVHVIAYSGENCFDTTTQVLSLRSIPQLAFDSLAPVCANTPTFLITHAQLINQITGTGVYSGPGINPAGNFNASLAGVGKDSLRYTFTANNTCQNSIQQYIQVFKAPKVSAGPDKVLLKGRSIVLSATSSDSSLRYVWTPNIALNNAMTLQPMASPITDVIYKLTATTLDGCSDSDEVLIHVLNKVYIPTAFTPNGDGINDVWHIPGLDPSIGAEVRVFNRWGNLVYHANGSTVNWDGTSHNQALPSGTYIYMVDLKNETPVLKGTIELIR